MTTLVRKDATPEGTNYTTSTVYGMGCEVNPVPLGCLTCSLPICKYDDPWAKQRERIKKAGQREATARELHRTGMRVPEIAARLGVSTRNVHRYVAGTQGRPVGRR